MNKQINCIIKMNQVIAELLQDRPIYSTVPRNNMGITARLHDDQTLLYLIADEYYDKAELMMKRGARPTERVPFGIYTHDPYTNALMLPIHFAVKNCAPPYIIELLLDAYPESIFDREGTGRTPAELMPSLADSTYIGYNYEIVKSILETRAKVWRE